MATKTKVQYDTLTINSSVLKAAVGTLSRIVPNRPSHPILATLLLVLEESISLTAFDLKVSLTMALATAQYSGEPRTLCIPAKLLSDILPHLSGDVVIKIDTESSQLLISAGKSKFKIGFEGSDQYPDISAVDGDSFSLDTSVIAGMAKLLPFASRDETKQVLNAVNLSASEDGTKIAAIDGHRLGYADLDFAVPKEFTINVPSDAVDLASKLAADETGVKCTVDAPVSVQFEGKGWTLTARLIEGQYPNYLQLIPKQFSKATTLNAAEFRSALNACRTVADLKNGVGMIDFSSESARIHAETAGIGDFEQLLDCDLQGDSVEVGFKVQYMQDALKLVGGESVTVQMNSNLNPVVLSGGGQFSALVMPVRIRE